jgi:RNA polymerase sigma-70 factor (ECF subfamily)
VSAFGSPENVDGEALSLKLADGGGRETARWPDARLVRGVRKGDTAAFEELVRRYIGMAHRVAYSIVGSPDLADDVCQESFLTVLKRIEQCRQPDHFKGWLLTIVRNRALNIRSSELLRSASSIDISGPFASSDDPDRDLERSELRHAIEGAAQQLSGFKREVYLLHDVEGLSHAEISMSLGISKGASRVHLHMARKTIRSRLSGTWVEEV